MKVVLNVPVVVDCDIESVNSTDEAMANLDKTDFVEITNVVFPSVIKVPASSVVIVG